MIPPTEYERVKALIEEMNEEFLLARGVINADYAEFAVLAFYEFQTALHDPYLTRDELIEILRRGMAQSRITCVGEDGDTDCWSDSMAYYIAEKAREHVMHRL